MDDIMQNAIMLMVVGMTTVFLILFLLIIFSKLLIHLVNRYVPIPIEGKKRISSDQTAITSSKFAAIIAAVETITKGKGNIEKIEKPTEDNL